MLGVLHGDERVVVTFGWGEYDEVNDDVAGVLDEVVGYGFAAGELARSVVRVDDEVALAAVGSSESAVFDEFAVVLGGGSEGFGFF